MNTIDFSAALGMTERTVTTNGDRRVACLGRTLATSIDDAWNACTDPERLQRWLGAVEGERREGGVVTLQMADGPNETATLTIVRCDAPRRLVVRWDWPGEPESIVELNLAPMPDGGASLALRHAALDRQNAVAYGAGWEDFLLRLGGMLDGATDQSVVDTAPFVEAATPIWRGLVEGAVDDLHWPRVTPDGDATITARVRHEFAAAPETVWSAITSAEHLSAWMAPVSGDLAVGGSWTLAYENGAALGTVRECEPARRFVTSWGWSFVADAPESTLTVELTATASGGTVLELVHERMPAPGTGYAAGWYAGARVLDRYLHGGSLEHADWQADWATAMAMIR